MEGWGATSKINGCGNDWDNIFGVEIGSLLSILKYSDYNLPTSSNQQK